MLWSDFVWGMTVCFTNIPRHWTTTAVTKDRVLGHNPVAALYTADSYYSKLKKSGKKSNFF